MDRIGALSDVYSVYRYKRKAQYVPGLALWNTITSKRVKLPLAYQQQPLNANGDCYEYEHYDVKPSCGVALERFKNASKAPPDPVPLLK